MANSYVRYTGNGSTTAFSIPFSYIDSSHLACTVAGSNTSFTLNAAGTTATLASAPANGAAIEFKRTTSQAARLTDYQAGSVLKEADLDNDSLQGFYMSQEAIDTAGDVITTDNADFQWTAGSKRIKNVADPTGAQDVATKNYTDTAATSQVTQATTQATAAAASATTASTQATNASNSATSASTSASTATTKASEASTSATNAAASATTASTQATNASTSASTATTKASEASTSASNAASSASAASTSATNAAASYDSFDDRYLGAKSSNPSVDNDGATLIDGALYFNSTNNVMMVYDLGNTTWLRTTPTSSDQTAINTVNSNSSNINTVAGQNSNITTLAGISSDITSVAGIASDVAAVENKLTEIEAVADDLAEASSEIDLVAGSIANVNTVGGAIANVNTVGGAIANVNTTASNITGVNSFAERYRVGSSDPASSNDAGDLSFNTSSNVLKYYDGSAWQTITADTDVKTKVSSNDTTAGFLNGKLVAGSNVTFTEGSDGGNETLTIAATDNSVSMAIALG
tara:strand:- start:2063 stop:3634 length:1572 start_codon:yes stop_codon:yes gene_type:complete